MKKEEILRRFRGGEFMSLTLEERRVVIRETSMRYNKERKKEKGKILDEFVHLTGYTRCYASYVLRTYKEKEKAVVYGKDGKRVVFVADRRKKDKEKRTRERIYEEDVLGPLIYLWHMSDYICGKRLKPYIKETLPQLKQFDEININEETEEKLLKMSPATIDRLLKKEKQKFNLKGRTLTKPGTLLKHSIPIRTFADWNEHEPGFVEVDLVGHDGGILKGDFLYSLDVTDIHTGWTETIAIKNKAQIWTIEALKEITKSFPFSIKGIDSDNGSEFINAHLLSYCEKEHITFTRSRPYRKNDNCFIEQKNYSVVRRALGYLRYDTDEELEVINKLYEVLRVYTNFFLPSQKLILKTREGSKVTKKYDKPKTPYLRVIESDKVEEKTKQQLKKQYDHLNPAELKRKVDRLQSKLYRLYLKEQRENAMTDKISNISDICSKTDFENNNFVYNFNEATK